MEDVETDAVTILNVLTLYPCARAILDYIPIRELVRSERVCREWQRAVRDYLHYCRVDTLYNVYSFYLKSIRKANTNINRKAQTYFAHKSLFTACESLEKFGPQEVSEDYFKNIISSCPYLQHLNTLSLNEVRYENSKLKISELIKYKRKSDNRKAYLHLTGDILKHIKSNDLTLKALRTAVYSLRNITTLELDDHAIKRDYMHLLLNAMPQLEKLSFCNYTCRYTSVLYNDPCTVSTDQLILTISQLTNLKRLYMRNNTIVNDALLEELAKLKELEYLDISYDSVYTKWRKKYSARGVAALCRSSLSVTTLCLGYIQSFTSASLALFVLDLPVVQELEKLGCCVELTPQWLEETSHASQTQMQPLELSMSCPNLFNRCLPKDEFYNLKIVLDTDVHTEQQFAGLS